MQTNSNECHMSLHTYRIMTVSQSTFSKTCCMCQNRGTLMSEKDSVGNVHHTQQVMDLLSFSYMLQPPEQMLL
jgi:hypothetical protein